MTMSRRGEGGERNCTSFAWQCLGIKEVSDLGVYRAAMAELVGTALFLYFNVAALVFGSNPIFDPDAGDNLAVSLSFGLSYFVLSLVASRVSGGHLNPAISLGVFCTGGITFYRLCLYTVSQLIGAVIGTAIVYSLTPSLFNLNGGGCTQLNFRVEGKLEVGWGCETLGTLLVVGTVLACSDEKSRASASQAALAPLAAGVAVFVVHVSSIPITGSSINPARSFGPAVVAGCWLDQWVYWIGPYTGAFLAAFLHLLIYRTPAPAATKEEGVLSVGGLASDGGFEVSGRRHPRDEPCADVADCCDCCCCEEKSSAGPSGKLPRLKTDKIHQIFAECHK